MFRWGGRAERGADNTSASATWDAAGWNIDNDSGGGDGEQYAPEGLWQIIRIFTGFYNIPVIVLVIVGLFTKRVPPIGAKIVIIMHIILYGLFQFVFKDYLDIHFLHLYAILFFLEVTVMLATGYLNPLQTPWNYSSKQMVDLTPWKYVIPLSVTLFSSIIFLYILFSPLGIVNGFSILFWPLVTILILINVFLWLVKIFHFNIGIKL